MVSGTSADAWEEWRDLVGSRRDLEDDDFQDFVFRLGCLFALSDGLVMSEFAHVEVRAASTLCMWKEQTSGRSIP